MTGDEDSLSTTTDNKTEEPCEGGEPRDTHNKEELETKMDSKCVVEEETTVHCSESSQVTKEQNVCENEIACEENKNSSEQHTDPAHVQQESL